MDNERLRRWRLVLGETEPDGATAAPTTVLSETDRAIDQVLAQLYEPSSQRGGGLGKSAPRVHRWLGDIRTYFPAPVVRIMQKDAMERLGLQRMLLEPELLAAVEPDVHLVATLLSLSRVIPKRTRETARKVVAKVADEVRKRLRMRLMQAVRGSLNRSIRQRRPRPGEIDWNRTIRANLRHYIPAKKTVIPERLVGFGRKRAVLRDVVLCVDQSGSMAESVVYSGILGAVLASIGSLRTRMLVFDTAVVDLTDKLSDPVDLLFSTQLGGGTDINQAIAYAERFIERPNDTLLFLISDLFEGGDAEELIARIRRLRGNGVRMACLLALADSGAPAFDESIATKVASCGVPAFGCTPDKFPDLLAAAIDGRNLAQFAAGAGLRVVAGAPTA